MTENQLFRINYSNRPVVVAGRQYVAHLDPDSGELSVDVTAPVAEIIEAVWHAALEMSREFHRLIPVKTEPTAPDVPADVPAEITPVSLCA